jgi:hypothetical protein
MEALIRSSPKAAGFSFASIPLLLAFVAAFTLTVTGYGQSPPVIRPSSGFNSQSVFVGANATFTITVAGDSPFVFQWRQDDAELPGQTNRTLRIGPTQPANEGGYDVVVSNTSGSVTSYVARLYAVPPTSELISSNHTNAASLRLPYFYHLPTGDDPARRSTGDFSTAGGKVSAYIARAYLPALPVLSVFRSSEHVTVSWTTDDSAGFALEQTGPLAAPAGWVPNSATVTDDGANKSVTLPATDSPQFFRLRRPSTGHR